MTYRTAIKTLKEYLKPEDVIEIELAMSIPGIGICLTVARIIREFNSKQEIEDLVCELLAVCLKHHFK